MQNLFLFADIVLFVVLSAAIISAFNRKIKSEEQKKKLERYERQMHWTRIDEDIESIKQHQKKYFKERKNSMRIPEIYDTLLEK